MKMEELVNHLKTTGYIYQGSEIYGGLANTWDYGPFGALLKNNVKQFWRQEFIQKLDNSYEVDSAILMHPKVWKASGHVDGFVDPLMDCKECKMRYRADNLIADFTDEINPDTLTNEEMFDYIVEQKINCPKCKKLNYTKPREFNLLFKTMRGVTADSGMDIYLRPENAQGEYTNYLNVMRSMRAKIPFGIGQIGKAFRNEITPGNFTYRTIEFEQMEYQVFCKPGEDVALYDHFKAYGLEFYKKLGLPEDKLRFKDHAKLVHYAAAACDIEYLFPFGWGEVNGTHNRTDYDLKNHEEHSGVNMHYLDPSTNEKYIPYIVESTYGADRTVLALLAEATTVEQLENDERIVMKLKPSIAPYKVAVLPLVKKHHTDKAKEVLKLCQDNFMTLYDETASIGKRYRRQDAVGTPFCITIDNETIENNTVTVRERDTMEQVTINLNELVDYIKERIKEE